MFHKNIFLFICFFFVNVKQFKDRHKVKKNCNKLNINFFNSYRTVFLVKSGNLEKDEIDLQEDVLDW